MKVTKYEHGVPSWIELSAPDPDAAARFYAKLFGWDVAEPDPDVGGLRLCRLDGAAVAGIRPKADEEQPTAWTTFVHTDDVDATASAVGEAGGEVLAGPFDAGTMGRTAVFADPTGAVFAGWQPGDHVGAELVNAHGALRKNDLNTWEPKAAMPFYRAVFGWETVELTVNDRSYYDWMLGERVVGGLMPMDEEFPQDLPSHWLTYFEVNDTPATVLRAKELGAEIMVPPTDSGPGVFAVVQDPQGAIFNIIRMN